VVSPDFSAEFFAAGFCYKDPASSPSDKWQLIDMALYDNMIQIGPSRENGSPAGGCCAAEVIKVLTYPLEETRTPNGVCHWVAETTLQDGRFFFVRSRHGAPNKLARQLVAAGIPDQPMEACDRRSGLKALTYRSFHAAAKWTYTEGAATLLQRVRYQEFHGLPESDAASVPGRGDPMLAGCPETVLGNTEKGGGTPSEAVQHLPDGVTPKIGVGDKQAELRQCETCGRRFRPWRPQATYCSGACRQKAYRERSRKPEAGAGRWISL